MNFLRPVTPATTGPEWTPMRDARVSPPKVRFRRRQLEKDTLRRHRTQRGACARHAPNPDSFRYASGMTKNLVRTALTAVEHLDQYARPNRAGYVIDTVVVSIPQ